MAKEFTKVMKICEAISKYAIYILVAAVPILALPFTSEVLEFNKQAVLVVLVFIALFAQMIKVLVSGKFSANLSKANIAVAVMLIVYLLSTVFSSDRYGSFWGWPRMTSDSLLTIIGLCLFYFIVSGIISKKELFVSIVVFALSCMAAIIYGALQLFGLFVIPFGFAKSTAFNTVGSVANLGIMIAVLLPLFVALVITVSEKWLKILFGIGIGVSALALFLINFNLVWWVVLISCALVVAFGMFKRDLFDLRWLAIPIFFFVLALFFIIVKPVIGWTPQRSIEIYLNQSSTAEIVLKTIKEKPILGSGPGTFSFDFLKYKKSDFNKSQLWNIKFDSGASKILTNLATAGVLGVLSWLALIGVVIFYGVKFLIDKSGKDNSSSKIIIAGIFLAFLSQTVSMFLYSSNFVLDFIFFFLIACFIFFVSGKKDYTLSPSSFLTLGVTLIFTIVFIFGLGLIILEGQRYIADVNFNSGILAYAKGQSDKGLIKLENAITQNKQSDLYWSNISQAYLGKLSQLISKKDLTDAEKSVASVMMKNAINSAKYATDINPKNVSNWSNHAFICQSLIGIVDNATDCALSSYEKASLLDPNNPYYITQKGIVLLTKKDYNGANAQFDKAIQLKSDYAAARFQKAMVLQAQGKTDQVIPSLEETQKYAPGDIGLAFQIGLLYYQNKDYKLAQAQFERAIAINPNYSNALYFLALAYSAQNQNDKAITIMKDVVRLNPDNAEVKTVLSNLQSGNDPLSGITQQNPPQEPVKEDSSEKTSTSDKIKK